MEFNELMNSLKDEYSSVDIQNVRPALSKEDLLDDLKNELNHEQFSVATHTDGPAVVMAGAGSGKTHTLVSRVKYLCSVDPSAHILMITFTKKAAEEMQERVLRSGFAANDKILACTYHSFCHMLLMKYGRKFGLSSFNVVKPQGFQEYIKAACSLKADFYKPISKMKGKLANLYSKSINAMVPLKHLIMEDEQFKDLVGLETLVEALRDDVSELMKNDTNGSAVTYDDLMDLTNKLLDDDIMAAYIAGMYKYIMVDEFQDTNNLQESILLKLGRHNPNIVVVGDISQSIYGFRAANVKNIQNFDKHLDNCKVITLPKNYRSSQEILDFANSVMHRNRCSWRYFDMVSATDKHGALPKLAILRDAEAEAMFVFNQIVKLHESKGYPLSDIAILTRGSAQTANLEVLLDRYEIPYDKRGGKKFIEHPCIIAVMSYLTLLINPYDLPAIQTVLTVEEGVGDVTAGKIAIAINKDKVFDISECYNMPRLRKAQKASLMKFCDFFKRLRTEEDFQKQFQMVANYYVKTAADAILHSNMDDKDAAAEQLEAGKVYIQRLDEMSRKYNDVMDFVNDFNINATDSQDDAKDRLIVSTVHSAKGLEWKIVFLMSCYEGGFPQRIDVMDYGTEKDEEELRCFYVAITRAKNLLVMTMPATAYAYVSGIGRMLVNTSPSHYIQNAAKTSYRVYIK